MIRLPAQASEAAPERAVESGATGTNEKDSGRAARRAARAQWPVRKFRLGDEPGPDLSATTTAEERLAMMWPLAREAWALAGRAVPDYPRNLMPIRVIRPAGGRPRS